MQSRTPSEGEAELRQPILLQATRYVAEYPAIAERLSTWIHKREQSLDVADEPLTGLLHQHLRTMIRHVYDVVAGFDDFCRQVEEFGYDRVDSGSLYITLRETNVAIFEALELMDLYAHEERRGHEGDLNALFAYSHILNRTNSKLSDKMLMRRTGLALSQVLQEQSSIDPFCEHPEALADKFALLLASLPQQLRPRYVHMYPSTADTPYRVDQNSPTFHGSFATVQKVTDKCTGDTFAVKKFQDVVKNKNTKKVLREIGILEVCSHPNIVQFVEAFQIGGDESCIHIALSPWAPYTLQEFLESFDKQRKEACPWFCPDSSISDNVVYKIMAQLTEGVEYLHNRSIKHKDLKPENILLYHHRDIDLIRPIIADVGVSKIYRPGGSTNYKDSTYVYLAPEQHSREQSTLKADIWQLGCCFAALLVVAKNGRSGLEQLKDSYIRDEVNCSCAIGIEHAYFIEALERLYLPANGKQSLLLQLVISMLDMDPDKRSTIKQVKAVTQKLAAKGKKRNHAGTAVPVGSEL